MLSLKLFKFSKKPNSTKVPTGSGSNVASFTQVLLVEGTSVQNPIFHITTGPSTLTDYSRFNYAYCSTLARYYKIEEFTWYPDGWRIRCSTDLLASLRSVIGASTQYITRSSAAYDGNIIDEFYQLKTDPTVYSGWVDSTQPWLANIDTGCYIVGVLSPDPQFGSLTYYAMPGSSLAVLCDYLLNDAITTTHHFDPDNASLPLQKALIDPFQYIKSCVFMPFTYSVTPGDTPQTNFPIWEWNVPNCPCKRLLATAPYYADSREFDMPKHPQTTDRGNFLNTSPFTTAELYFPPFGTIRLDTSTTCNYPHLYMQYRVDLVSGLGTLWVWATKTGFNSDKVLIANVETQVGVPIQLSQVTRDYAGMAGGILGSAASLLTGNIVGGVAGFVGSVAKGIYPHTSTIGSGGTFYQLNFDASLNMTFYPVIQEYNAYFGRPLCGPGKISDYAGYIETQGAVLTTGTSGFLASEIETTQEIMNGGFYYE